MGIKIGDVVVVDFGGEERKYRLGLDSNPKADPPIVSIKTPLGKVLQGKEKDEEFVNQAPSGDIPCRIVDYYRVAITQEEIEESLIDQTKDIHEHCKELIEDLRNKLRKTEDVIKVLQDGIGLPEKKVKLMANKDLLSKIVNMYIDTLMLDDDNGYRDFYLNKLNFILKDQRIEIYGKVEDIIPFDEYC